MIIQRHFSRPVLGAALLLVVAGISFLLFPAFLREWNRSPMDDRLLRQAMEQYDCSRMADSTDAMEDALEKGANVNVQSFKGVTALIYCASYGNVEGVKLLLRYHADVNIRTRGGGSALDAANRDKNEEVVRLLQQAGGK